MKYETGKIGRVIVVRLEDGEIIHEQIERIARDEGIRCATVSGLGGIDVGSRLVVGPREPRNLPPEPQEIVLDNVYEATGNGTIAPGENGQPVLHMHLACGRMNSVVAGCIRRGVRVWHVFEVVITELEGVKARRVRDQVTGFELLEPETR